MKVIQSHTNLLYLNIRITFEILILICDRSWTRQESFGSIFAWIEI